VGGIVGALIAVPVVSAIEVMLAPLQAREVPVAPEPHSADSTPGADAAPDAAPALRPPDMVAAARALRARKPRRIIVAVPVGSEQAVAALAREVDEVVCPSRPEPFIAIGLHYGDFSQVEDTEVLDLLRAYGR
jgi:hypothetical protein